MTAEAAPVAQRLDGAFAARVFAASEPQTPLICAVALSKVAVQDLLLSMVTLMVVVVTVEQPLQAVKVEPLFGFAVMVAIVPTIYGLVTPEIEPVPVPVPDVAVVIVTVAAGGAVGARSTPRNAVSAGAVARTVKAGVAVPSSVTVTKVFALDSVVVAKSITLPLELLT